MVACLPGEIRTEHANRGRLTYSQPHRSLRRRTRCAVYSTWLDKHEHEWFRLGQNTFPQNPRSQRSRASQIASISSPSAPMAECTRRGGTRAGKTGRSLAKPGLPNTHPLPRLPAKRTGRDGGVYPTWWDGSWHDWFRIFETVFAQRTSITAIARSPDHIDLFAVGRDGSVNTASWNEGWHDWSRVSERGFAQRTPVAALARTANHIDLFAVGLDRGTYSAWWDGEWHEWFRLAERSFEPNAPITAVSREPNHMDLFAVGPDGGAYSTWWDNGWHDWFPIE